MTIDEALYNIKQGYGIPHKHDTLTTITEYVKKTEPCEDAISRQAVIDLVAANRTEVSWTNVIMYSPFYKGLIQLPPVQPKVVPIAEVRFDDDKLHEIVDEAVKNIEIKSEWIPVSERLPEENKRCLCSYKDEEGECIDFGLFKDGTWYAKGVVAWMPLPEPYKAESEESDADSG